MKKINSPMTVLLAFFMLVPFSVTADNNFSRELLKQKPVEGSVTFRNPRDGWVFFKSGMDSRDLPLEGREKRTVRLVRGEGFAELPAGTYQVRNLSPSETMIRTAPALLFYFFAGDFERPRDSVLTVTHDTKYGRTGMYIYHWKYLRENILPNFNMLISAGSHPELDTWRGEGRKLIVSIPMNPKAETREAAWTEKLTASRNDGIIVDEFILPTGASTHDGGEFGYTSPGLGFDALTLAAVRSVGRLARKRSGNFYAWLGIPWDSRTEDVKPLLEALRAENGYLLWEAYAFSRNYQQEMKIRLLNRTAGFLHADKQAFESILIAPSTMEFSDNNAEIDFKVWLEKQVNAIAVNPEFSGIRGLSMYVAHYTTPEILRWYSALLRHYALEGRTEMLSEQYGYQLKPGILENPEWRDQLNHWTVDPAMPGSISILEKSEWGFRRGYFPKSENTLLRMKRVRGKVNAVSQELKNLQEGKLYSLRILVTAPARTAEEKYLFSVALNSCEILENRFRLLRDYPPDRTNRQCWNACDLVFRYLGGTPALLTIRDVAAPESAGPGRGTVSPEEILIDSIRIAPYFPAGMEERNSNTELHRL